MPLIFELTCAACGFTKEMTTGYAVVDLDDGREEICGHPTERRQAERLTGLPWSELVKLGRIGYRYALTCRGCGCTDYYRTQRPSRRGPFSGLVGGVTHIPSEREASTHRDGREFTVADRDGANTINIAGDELFNPLPRSDWGDLAGPVTDERVTGWRPNDRFHRCDLMTLRPSTFTCVTFG